MSREQQIIATHDTLPGGRSPMDAVKAAINALTVGPPPIFIAIDALRPYPMRDLGPPDWLLVSVAGDQPTFGHTDWRKVIEATPQNALVVLLSQGEPSDVPREVVQHVDLTGWHGDVSDRRINAVARRVAGGTSAWRRDDEESDAVHRGALVHVGDGTTMLNPKLLSKIVDLDLSTGALRILRNQNMIYIGDLACFDAPEYRQSGRFSGRDCLLMGVKPIRLGTEQVTPPPLRGAIGPDRLRSRYPGMNAQADLVMVDKYLAAVAKLRHVATNGKLPASTPQQTILIVADAVRDWKADRNAAIAAFQRVEAVGSSAEKADGVITPNGATWRSLVTYGELSIRLEGLRDQPKGPIDYIHTGGFHQQDFATEAARQFRSDALIGSRFNQISVPGMLDLLRRISHDARIIDVRWIAYMLATAMWESAADVARPGAQPNARGKIPTIKRWGTPSEENGKGFLHHDPDRKTKYYLPVKVNALPGGRAEVVEQDGDKATIETNGQISFRTPRSDNGSDPFAAATSAYRNAAGRELYFYGRGYNQLTWWFNYATAGYSIGRGLDLLFRPELMLNADIAYSVFSVGMVTGEGWPPAKKRLQYYIAGVLKNYVGARAIVNGTDMDQQIARAAQHFEDALMATKA